MSIASINRTVEFDKFYQGYGFVVGYVHGLMLPPEPDAGILTWDVSDLRFDLKLYATIDDNIGTQVPESLHRSIEEHAIDLLCNQDRKLYS